jgi:hypothetical protein
MPCPHLKEVVMLYCDALAVKKMVPLDRLVSADPCLTCNYELCPIYLLRAKTAVLSEQSSLPGQPLATRKES